MTIFLGILAALLLLDGVATIVSARYYVRRQRLLRMTVKAPAHVDERKYHLINRIIAGMCVIGAGAIVLFWIYQSQGAFVAL